MSGETARISMGAVSGVLFGLVTMVMGLSSGFIAAVLDCDLLVRTAGRSSASSLLVGRL